MSHEHELSGSISGLHHHGSECAPNAFVLFSFCVCASPHSELGVLEKNSWAALVEW